MRALRLLGGFAALLPAMASAIPSIIPLGGGGIYNLVGGTLYDGKIYISSATTINGNGATLNLGAGNDLSVAPGASLTLNNVTIKGGVGLVQGNGSIVTGTGVTFDGTDKGAYSQPTAMLTLTDSIFRNQVTATVDATASTLRFNNVVVESGPNIVLFGGANLDWEGGSYGAGTGVGVNVQSSNPSSKVVIRNVNFSNRTSSAIVLTQFDTLTMENVTITDCVRGVDGFRGQELQNTSVSIKNLTVTGTNIPIGTVQEGIQISNTGTILIEDVNIRDTRSGIVLIDSDNATIRRASLTNNNTNQINTTRVGNAVIEDCYLKSAPIRGTINVEDFDIYYTENSGSTIRRSFLIDAADNGVLNYGANTVVEDCFISGAQTNGIQVDDFGGQNGRVTVRDCTVINSGNQDIFAQDFTFLDAKRVIAGSTDTPATPSALLWPANQAQGRGVGFQIFTAGASIANSLVARPKLYGFQAYQVRNSTTGTGSSMRFSTIAGRRSPATLEGAVIQDGGSKVAFSDNQIFDIQGPDHRCVMLFLNTAMTDMQRNSIGDPGDAGILEFGAGASNAENNYFGVSSGPSGPAGVGGLGSSVTTGSGGSIDVTPFETERLHDTTLVNIPVSSTGAATPTVFDTGRIKAIVNYQGTATGAAMTAVAGMTHYRHSVTPISPPGLTAEDRAYPINLWLDKRLELNRGASGSLSLTFTAKDLTGSFGSATLWWDSSTGIRSLAATSVGLDGVNPRATFTFAGGTAFPTSTMSVVFRQSPLPEASDDANTVLANLTEQHWSSATSDSTFLDYTFVSTTFDTAGGLAIRLAGATNTFSGTKGNFGFWQTKKTLQPLPAGNYKLTTNVEFLGTPTPPSSYAPEVRVRIGSETGLTQRMASAADSQNPRIPTSVPLFFTSNGVDKWGLAIDMIAFSSTYTGGLRIKSFVLEKID